MLTCNIISTRALMLVACMAALLHMGSARPQRIGRNNNIAQRRGRQQADNGDGMSAVVQEVSPEALDDIKVALSNPDSSSRRRRAEQEPTVVPEAMAETVDMIPPESLTALMEAMQTSPHSAGTNDDSSGMPAPAGRSIRRRARQEANDNTISAAEITKLIDEGGDSGDQQRAGRGLAIVRDRRGRLFVALPIDDSDQRQGRLNPLLLEAGTMALESGKDLMKGFNEGLAAIAMGGRSQTLIMD